MTGFSGGGAGPKPRDAGTFYLRALDAATGKRMWEYPMPGPGVAWSGTVSTAGGVVFVGEALSSAIQKGYYKFSRWRTGTPVRVFRMAPLHHHFELGGWSETQITQRFVLITMVATLIGVSLALSFQQSHTVQTPAPKPSITEPEH
jgi:hypothetical protein